MNSDIVQVNFKIRRYTKAKIMTYKKQHNLTAEELFRLFLENKREMNEDIDNWLHNRPRKIDLVYQKKKRYNR
jgi:hypothetical protein